MSETSSEFPTFVTHIECSMTGERYEAVYHSGSDELTGWYDADGMSLTNAPTETSGVPTGFRPPFDGDTYRKYQNKYTKKQIEEEIDILHKGTYNRILLTRPKDFNPHNTNNPGFFFIDFKHPLYVIDFYYNF